MRYRILPPGEWDRLKEIVPDGFIPNSDLATAAIAENDSGEITGVLFFQLALHMEPLILKSSHASFYRLYETLLEEAKSNKGMHFYVFSDKDIVDKMAEYVGMKRTAFKVFEGEVK